MNDCFRIGVFILTAGLHITGAMLAYNDKTASASIVFGAAIMCMIFLFLSQFKTFKGFGVQAELWEEKQVEVVKLLDSLRPATAELGRMIITMAARMGRVESTMNRTEMIETTKNIERLLKSLNVDPSEIEKVKTSYYKLTTLDIACEFIEAYDELLQEKLASTSDKIKGMSAGRGLDSGNREYLELRERESGIENEINELHNVWNIENIDDTYDALCKLVNSSKFIDSEEKQNLFSSKHDQLEDLKYFIKYKEIRRPNVWYSGSGL